MHTNTSSTLQTLVKAVHATHAKVFNTTRTTTRNITVLFGILEPSGAQYS